MQTRSLFDIANAYVLGTLTLTSRSEVPAKLSKLRKLNELSIDISIRFTYNFTVSHIAQFFHLKHM
jgi:hypothetical protein